MTLRTPKEGRENTTLQCIVPESKSSLHGATSSLHIVATPIMGGLQKPRRILANFPPPLSRAAKTSSQQVPKKCPESAQKVPRKCPKSAHFFLPGNGVPKKCPESAQKVPTFPRPEFDMAFAQEGEISARFRRDCKIVWNVDGEIGVSASFFMGDYYFSYNRPARFENSWVDVGEICLCCTYAGRDSECLCAGDNTPDQAPPTPPPPARALGLPA